MKKTSIILLLFVLLNNFYDRVYAEDKELSSLEFLNAARYPRGKNSWAKMNGTISNLKRLQNGERVSEEHPLFVAIRFTQIATIGQVVIPNKEGYNIGQFYSEGNRTTTLNDMNDSKRDIFPRFGIDPRDLTMSFLFWNFQKELSRDAVKGRECRVFILKSLESKKTERVKVYISSEYAFPMKAEWIKDGEENFYRSLEVKSFKKDADSGFWLVDVIKIEGKSSRTIIKFTSIDADFEKNEPENLYMTSININSKEKDGKE